ncbi:MAG: hypothetical protein L3J71_09495 [Victivallaceae bacterium]|nr:hypothetical protein [Victivallaceae bacterium]
MFEQTFKKIDDILHKEKHEMSHLYESKIKNMGKRRRILYTTTFDQNRCKSGSP